LTKIRENNVQQPSPSDDEKINQALLIIFREKYKRILDALMLPSAKSVYDRHVFEAHKDFKRSVTKAEKYNEFMAQFQSRAFGVIATFLRYVIEQSSRASIKFGGLKNLILNAMIEYNKSTRVARGMEIYSVPDPVNPGTMIKRRPVCQYDINTMSFCNFDGGLYKCNINPHYDDTGRKQETARCKPIRLTREWYNKQMPIAPVTKGSHGIFDTFFKRDIQTKKLKQINVDEKLYGKVEESSVDLSQFIDMIPEAQDASLASELY
jgi:hypothetical protein